MSAVFITGGSGFVGAHVARAFADAGDEVTVFAPAPGPCLTEADLARVRFVGGSVTDESLVEALRAARPDIVVALAAYGEGGRGLLAAAAEDEAAALAVNVGGFRNLLVACTDIGLPRLLWASSLSVFGDPALYRGGIAGEDAPRRPETFYGLTKVLAEDLARFYRDQRGLVVSGLRLPLVFGAGLWYRGVAHQIVRMFDAAARGEPITVEAPADAVDLIYVKDVARAFIHLARHHGALGATYNLKAFTPTFAEIADTVRAIAPEARVTLARIEPAYRYPTMATGKLNRETGFAPAFDLRSACEDYINDLGAR